MPNSTQFIAAARAQVGKPYVFGAVGPDGFDCSGLVQFAAAATGWTDCPRSSAAQATVGAATTRAALVPGDLIFFDFNTPPAAVKHVGIYLGNGKMINAQSQSPAAVTEASIDSGYWNARILGFRHVFAGNEVVARENVASAATLDSAPTVPEPPKKVAKPKDVMM